jgi:hypothetical protein
MHSTHAAALNVIRESCAMLSQALEGLPDLALDWTPAPAANSLCVLTRHALSATRFWLACGSGPVPSLARYRADDRGPAFASKGVSASQLQGEIAKSLSAIETILSAGEATHLEQLAAWPDVDQSDRRTGVEALFHAVGHLREHVGQAQLMRDLWFAGNP